MPFLVVAALDTTAAVFLAGGGDFLPAVPALLGAAGVGGKLGIVQPFRVLAFGAGEGLALAAGLGLAFGAGEGLALAAGLGLAFGAGEGLALAAGTAVGLATPDDAASAVTTTLGVTVGGGTLAAIALTLTAAAKVLTLVGGGDGEILPFFATVTPSKLSSSIGGSIGVSASGLSAAIAEKTRPPSSSGGPGGKSGRLGQDQPCLRPLLSCSSPWCWCCCC